MPIMYYPNSNTFLFESVDFILFAKRKNFTRESNQEEEEEEQREWTRRKKKNNTFFSPSVSQDKAQEKKKFSQEKN